MCEITQRTAKRCQRRPAVWAVWGRCKRLQMCGVGNPACVARVWASVCVYKPTACSAAGMGTVAGSHSAAQAVWWCARVVARAAKGGGGAILR